MCGNPQEEWIRVEILTKRSGPVTLKDIPRMKLNKLEICALELRHANPVGSVLEHITKKLINYMRNLSKLKQLSTITCSFYREQPLNASTPENHRLDFESGHSLYEWDNVEGICAHNFHNTDRGIKMVSVRCGSLVCREYADTGERRRDLQHGYKRATPQSCVYSSLRCVFIGWLLPQEVVSVTPHLAVCAGIGNCREFNDLYARLHSSVFTLGSDVCSLAAAPESRQCYFTPGSMVLATRFHISLLLARESSRACQINCDPTAMLASIRMKRGECLSPLQCCNVGVAETGDPTYENPGVTSPGIELGSLWEEMTSLTATPLRHQKFH
ncbi:hypothetical protein PR048_009484 [Dryococelus australis]|uniref:Uncharacterized protein n=1 Tax=Dryococelus australis TaxID=614101 RepID=A0ABQ9I028_9NEOP|nr:hypothetical protein PR048_009484 [Dryococelus australis]